MQRLYSMFPHGGPGVGLLLLRVATAAMFALNITHRFNFGSPVVYWAVVSAIALISFSLCLGFLTPILAAIACVTAVANIYFLADQPGAVVYVLRILTSGALFFLGPGAYSVDARLFGLRVTVVPPRKSKNGRQLFI
jgi:uncharacterized membrane protein YphA (DoxX/SURF4 family)